MEDTQPKTKQGLDVQKVRERLLRVLENTRVSNKNLVNDARESENYVSKPDSRPWRSGKQITQKTIH